MASTAFCQVTPVPSTFVALVLLFIVADALFMIVLPIAGGHGGIVISQKADDMYFAGATTRTGYVARGIAGKEADSCVQFPPDRRQRYSFRGLFL